MSGTGKFPRSKGAFPVIFMVIAVVAAGALCVSLLSQQKGAQPVTAGIIPGMTIDEPSQRGEGLIVTSLRTGSEAERDGIVAGDRLIAINHHTVSSLRDVGRQVDGAGGQKLELEILHNRMRQDIVLQIQ